MYKIIVYLHFKMYKNVYKSCELKCTKIKGKFGKKNNIW